MNKTYRLETMSTDMNANFADILKSEKTVDEDCLRTGGQYLRTLEPVWRSSLRDGLQIHSTWVQFPEPAPLLLS